MSIKYLNWAFSLLDFKPIQKVILLSLADNSDDDGVSFPSIGLICAKTGIKSRTTVIKHIKSMCHIGLISIAERSRKDGSQSSNEYKLNIEFEGGFTPCSINEQRCSANEKSDVTDEQGTVQQSEWGSVQQIEQLGVQLNEHQEPSLEPPYKPSYEPPLQKTKKSRFVPPTISECETFFFNEKNITDQTMPSMFWNYYQSNGWMVGRSKMKDWHASANGWIGRQKKYGHSNQSQLQKPKPIIQQMADALRASEHTNSEMMGISYDK